MVDNVVPTLAPKQETPKVLESFVTEKNTLFDSLAQEGFASDEETKGSKLKTFFTGLLWFGYTVAIVVALVLIGSAALSMMKLMSR